MTKMYDEFSNDGLNCQSMCLQEPDCSMTMPDKEKKRFHEMTENNKKRYDAEMQNYTSPKEKHIKDPNARALSGFFWFCNDERPKVKEANPEYGILEIAKELSRRWSDAEPETKSKYEQIAETDKARFENAMSDKKKKHLHEMTDDKKRYDAEMPNNTPPKRKYIKDPNAPKKALSAFFWFCNDERAKVKKANPEYGVVDIAKELGRMWSDAKPETKLKYEQIAKIDDARYKKEIIYEKNNPLIQQQAPVPEPEEQEEVEEEEEDDDD